MGFPCPMDTFSSYYFIILDEQMKTSFNFHNNNNMLNLKIVFKLN